MHLSRAARAMGAASGTDLAGPVPGPGSPFPITFGPEVIVAHRGWTEARGRVLSAVLAGPGLVLVLGAPGTGKSLLLQDIARALRAEGADVVLQPRGDLPVAPVPRREGRRLVVLIDEADRMDDAALEGLARLGRCAVVLAGVRDPGNGQADGSPAAAAVVRLSALPPGEVGAFVAARLAQSGLGAEALSGEAVARLAERSGGMPRVLNMLVAAALLLAGTEPSSRVEAAHVDQAAALRDGDLDEQEGPAAGIAPGIVPCRLAEPPPAAGGALPAPAEGAGPRRRLLVAACLVCGVAAVAVGGLAAWHGGQARHEAPVMASAPLAPVPLPSVAPAPQPGTPSAARPAAALAQAETVAPPAPKLPVPRDPVPREITPEAAPAPAARPPEPEALPPSAPAHVMVRYARESADAAARAASLALALRAAGLAVDAVAPVPRRDAKPGARYFFAEDQGAAASVLKAAGLPGSGSLAAPTGLNAAPRPGLIEVTVPPGQVEAGGRSGPPNPGRS